MGCDQKVVMTIEIGEDGKVIAVKDKEGRKVEALNDGCKESHDIEVGTIESIVPMTLFRAHNSPRCWYFFDGRWYKLC